MTNHTPRALPEHFVYFLGAASAVPTTTPHARLLDLLRRYGDRRDPVIAAMPARYRAAVEIRIRQLLSAPMPGTAS